MGRKPKSATALNILKGSNPTKEAVSVNQKSRLPSSKKAATSTKIMVRRSGRVQNMASLKPNETKDIVADPINLVESENEDLMQDEQSDSEPTPINTILEEKIDHLIEIVNELNSKATKRAVFSGETLYTELNYKSMYIESQKKVEDLREKNDQLNKELQFALGKVEAYDKMKDVIFQLRDSLIFSSLGKTTEAMINFTSQTAIDKSRAPDATTLDATENLKVAPKIAAEPRAGRPKKKAMLR